VNRHIHVVGTRGASADAFLHELDPFGALLVFEPIPEVFSIGSLQCIATIEKLPSEVKVLNVGRATKALLEHQATRFFILFIFT
jgi:hypothetical protein